MLTCALLLTVLTATVSQLNANPITTTKTDRCAAFNGVQSTTTTQCFTFVDYELAFREAEIYCQTNFSGNLASIHSAFDNMLIVENAKARFEGALFFYIGLTKNGADVWKWRDGTPVDYTDWKSFLPSAPNCVNVDIYTAKARRAWHAFPDPSTKAMVVEVVESFILPSICGQSPLF
uniref:C-type lectin domain-containing protein n=1 Tax=Panagrellus redivivus TaxID=6233 RepID=A0A7E4VNE0_PANRE